MSNIRLTSSLREEYERLFDDCRIRNERHAVVESTVNKLLAKRDRYEAVVSGAGEIPWFFVAVIHNMESSQNFKKHLHNGDPLTARTHQVPAGRPRNGQPPFAWEESALDALKLKRLHLEDDWSLASCLYRLEQYNGWGYRKFHPHVLSPYLWGFSLHYESGKYVADGRWSETAVSRQCGAATLLRRMAENSQIEFADQPPPEDDGQPAVVPFAASRPRSEAVRERAIRLQAWLNTFPGIFLREDGWPGRRTSDAYHRVTGQFLPGDPQA